MVLRGDNLAEPLRLDAVFPYQARVLAESGIFIGQVGVYADSKVAVIHLREGGYEIPVH